MEKIDTDCKQRNWKVQLNFSNRLAMTEPLYSAFTETGATHTMKTNQMAELKQ